MELQVSRLGVTESCAVPDSSSPASLSELHVAHSVAARYTVSRMRRWDILPAKAALLVPGALCNVRINGARAWPQRTSVKRFRFHFRHVHPSFIFFFFLITGPPPSSPLFPSPPLFR